MRQVIPFYKEIVFKTNIASITSISLEHEEKVFDGEITGDFIVFGDYKIHNDTTEKELFKYRLPFTALIPDDIDKNTVCVDIENFTYEQIEDDVLKVNIDFSIEGEVIKNEEAIEKLESLDNLDEVERFEEDEEDGVEEVEIAEDKCELVEEDLFEDELFDEEINREIDEILTRVEEKEDIEERDDEMQEIMDAVENVTQIKKEKKEEVLTEVNVDNEEKTVEVVEKEVEEIKEEYVTYHIHIVKENESLEQILKIYNVNIDSIKEYNEITDIKIGDKIIIPEYLDE